MRKHQDVSVLLRGHIDFNEINLEIFTDFENLASALLTMVILMRKENADQKKIIINHNFAAVKRMKETLEDNTTNNYRDLIYVKNLRKVDVKIMDLGIEDRKSLKNNIPILLKRSRVDKTNLKFVTKDDIQINGIYRNVLMEVGE